MVKYFLHVGINFKGKPNTGELKPLFETALDWITYAPNCWILYTTSSTETWYKHLKARLDDKDTFFICELNLNNRQGWLPKDIWQWIERDRSEEKNKSV
jgi:hypothetical protein